MSPLLTIEGLTMRLPALARRPLLDDVSLTVSQGEVVGLVGESGSGKSLTARSVLALLPPNAQVSGRVAVEGKVQSGVEVPTMIRSRLSAGHPAISRACLAALAHMSLVASSGSARRR